MSVAGIIIIGVVFALLIVVGVIALCVHLANKNKNNMSLETFGDKSYFDGGTLGLIGMNILTGFLTIITLGIAYPWTMCMLERWKAKHTVISGRRLKFTGKGLNLLGRYLLWWLLSFVTLGIYSLWFSINMERWRVKHLEYEDGRSEFESKFTASIGGWFVINITNFFITVFTFGLGSFWASKRMYKWKAEHTEIGGSTLVFHGTAGQLFVKYLLLAILTPLTLGIYAWFFPVSLLKWEISNTEALYKTPDIVKLSTEHKERANVDFAKYRIAANDTELMFVKHGITGNETIEQLEALASAGSSYAQYMLALNIKGDSETFDGRALELLKTSADGKYHKALYDYALYIEKESKIKYAEYLEEAAKQGNTDAPWLLKTYYEQLAVSTYPQNTASGLEMLKKAAYWFKISIEQENKYTLEVKNTYNDMVEKIAIWQAREFKPKSTGIGVVIALVFAGIIVIGGIISAVAVIFGMRLGTLQDIGINQGGYVSANEIHDIEYNGEADKNGNIDGTGTSGSSDYNEFPSVLYGGWSSAWREEDGEIWTKYLEIKEDGTFIMQDCGYMNEAITGYFSGEIGWHTMPVGFPEEYGTYTYSGTSTNGVLELTFTGSSVFEIVSENTSMEITIDGNGFRSDGHMFVRGRYGFEELVSILGVDTSVNN